MDNKTSHKKSILNFNAAEWRVEKPVSRPKTVVPPPPPRPVQPQPVQIKKPVATQPKQSVPTIPAKQKKSKSWLWALIVIIVAVTALFIIITIAGDRSEEPQINPIEVKLSSMQDGDIIELGSYPQSLVSDSDTLATLEGKESTLSWVSYKYYYDDGESAYGYPTEGDYMLYADVEIDEEKYRAVKFTEYRPYNTPLECSDDYSYQDDNGYYTDNVYWFKYEPLKWKVLDADEGLLLCENVISSKEFEYYIYDDDEFYASDEYIFSPLYFYCYDFYDMSFSSDEKAFFKDYDLGYGDDSIIDYAFMLSYDQATNYDYGFSEYDGSLKAEATDYAECQGVYTDSYDNAYWWLRTGDVSDLREADVVTPEGDFDSIVVNNTSIGFRPAIKVSKTSRY